MRKITAFLFVIFLVAGLGLGTAWVVRNPERTTLGPAERAAVPGQFVTLSDGVTHYELSGPPEGLPVVLVHGFSVPSYIWDSTAVALAAAGYRVLRYDLFGRGWSDRPKVAYDADLYDRQLGELLDSAGFAGPVHTVGLSFGGFVTATFTGRHPERVRSLTLVDPAAGDRTMPPWFIRAPVLGPVLWQTLAVPGMADNQLSDFAEPARWPDWPHRYRVQMKYRGFGRALRSTIMSLSGADLDSVYATVGRQSFPVQLIWGTEDRTVPIGLSEGVRAAIPRVQFHPIEGAGHLPHMERTEVVNPLLLSFLRTVDAAGEP
ncbi:MAG TPA: alpha/beta fold hydrolase [Gemmatimonadales bacterium]